MFSLKIGNFTGVQSRHHIATNNSPWETTGTGRRPYVLQFKHACQLLPIYLRRFHKFPAGSSLILMHRSRGFLYLAAQSVVLVVYCSENLFAASRRPSLKTKRWWMKMHQNVSPPQRTNIHWYRFTLVLSLTKPVIYKVITVRNERTYEYDFFAPFSVLYTLIQYWYVIFKFRIIIT